MYCNGTTMYCIGTAMQDVYSFGVVLWELLTFEIPWGNRNQWQVSSLCPCDGGGTVVVAL
jgi:hypothetical protein